MKANYSVWIEIQANKRTITDAEKFRQAMEKCKEAGIGAIILSVKDTFGFTIYESEIADHYSEFDEVFERKDYLLSCFEIIHGLGMKLYAAIDVFTEGSTTSKHPKMKALVNKDWQTYVYGINEEHEAVIQPLSEGKKLKTIGSIDDFGEVFVNPANDEVCAYELSLLNEIMVKYPIDGIVLDRVRYVGLSSDFSPITKAKWEQFIGGTCAWPEDIYRINENGDQIEIEYGKYFGDFVTFRADVIRQFIEKVRALVDAQSRKIEFWDYTGSWYPLYYQVGANWASKTYEAKAYPWIDLEKYKKTGYAEQLDGLLSGFYYSYVTEQEAKQANQPAYWYSVEGSGRLAAEVTKNMVPIVGSLFLEQYRDNLASMKEAVKMCFKTSVGCMLFDLSYLVDNDWWQYVTVKSSEEFTLEVMKESSFPEFMDLWKACFPDEFRVTEAQLRDRTFQDERLCQKATLCIRSKEDNQLLGAIVCKTGKADDEMYQDSSWLTALLVKPEYQNKGYGKKLYDAAEKLLIKKGVKKIVIGQDFNNFFSGIPAPTDKKIGFFEKLGFMINRDEHYDLTADIVCNDKIDHFDTASFVENFIVEVLQVGENQALYKFLEEEFPGRWFFEAKAYLGNGGNPQNIVVLKDRLSEKIKGYCVVHVNEDCSGGLGPIGISVSVRGKNNGDFILQQSLLHLRKLGAKEICIDWTVLKDFYGKFDFKPIRIYRSGYKEFKG